MTLDQLETMIAITEEGGLKGASEKLNKTRPSLSSGLKNLEAELGIEIFDRKGYRMKLTSGGQRIYELALDLIKRRDVIFDTSQELKTGIEPKVKIAIDYLTPYSQLITSIEEFVCQHQFTEFDFSFEVLGGTEEKVLNQEYSFGLTPFISQHSKLQVEKICELKIVPVVSSLKKEQKDLPQIVVKDSASEKSNLDFGADSKFRKITVSDHLIKKDMIYSGLGWGHLESLSIKEDLESAKLIPFEGSQSQAKDLSLYLINLTDYELGPISKNFKNFLLRSLQN